ncbi:MAG: hypothetical protein EB127_19665 [Alphaproteobacteria bacterium]|jgi:hypothetical protein|nr:hypothetical protein [Alphaproteobacteria bacterium]
MKSKLYQDPDGTKRWCLPNGDYHRSNGPAVIKLNGEKIWFQHGKIHRTNGPAIVTADGTKAWFINNQCHRIDGPAIKYLNGEKRWVIQGKELSFEDWDRKRKLMWLI